MLEAQLCKVESADKALDRADWVIPPDIVLDPRRKQTGLIPALASLEFAIRHEPNRTSTLKTRHSCPASTGSLRMVRMRELPDEGSTGIARLSALQWPPAILLPSSRPPHRSQTGEPGFPRFRNKIAVDVVVVALMTPLTAVLLGQFDPMAFDPVDCADVDAIGADHVHMFLDFGHGIPLALALLLSK